MIDTRTRVIRIFAETLAIDADTITYASDGKGLGLDSLDRIELVMALEDEFGVEITDTDWDAVENVGQAVHVVETKLAARAEQVAL